MPAASITCGREVKTSSEHFKFFPLTWRDLKTGPDLSPVEGYNHIPAKCGIFMNGCKNHNDAETSSFYHLTAFWVRKGVVITHIFINKIQWTAEVGRTVKGESGWLHEHCWEYLYCAMIFMRNISICWYFHLEESSKYQWLCNNCHLCCGCFLNLTTKCVQRFFSSVSVKSILSTSSSSTNPPTGPGGWPSSLKWRMPRI